MFAIFLSEKMDPFYANISSFPTVFFTFFMLLTALYWAIAVLGLVDLDFLDIDIPEDASVAHEGVAGVLLRFGFHGVPMTIIISIWSFIGWLICYYLVVYIFDYVPDGIPGFIAGTLIFIISLYSSAFIAGKLTKPLRPLFNKMNDVSNKDVLGQTAIVRTLRLDDSFGEVALGDGGAGLILKARADAGVTFTKGDRVVLLEYIEESHIYRVIPENEFIN